MDNEVGRYGEGSRLNEENNNKIEELQTYVYEEADEENGEVSEHNKDIVFKFISGREYNINIFNEVLSKAWRPSGTISITDLGSGYYNARFSLLCDIAAVLQGTPWSVREDWMLLEKAVDGFVLEEYDFKHVVFGIHIYGLPFSMLNAEKVYNIAKTIGDPEPIDKEMAKKWGRFAKLRCPSLSKKLEEDLSHSAEEIAASMRDKSLRLKVNVQEPLNGEKKTDDERDDTRHLHLNLEALRMNGSNDDSSGSINANDTGYRKLGMAQAKDKMAVGSKTTDTVVQLNDAEAGTETNTVRKTTADPRNPPRVKNKFMAEKKKVEQVLSGVEDQTINNSLPQMTKIEGETRRTEAGETSTTEIHEKDIPAIGRSGRSVLLWNNSIDLEIIRADKNIIYSRIKEVDGNAWDLICVYGPPQNHLRNKFWRGLSLYDTRISNPWRFMRDLNAITSVSEKNEGSQKLSNTNTEFIKFIQERGLIDMGFIGSAFTWSNGVVVDKPIFERLDRDMCTADWFFKVPDNGVLHLPRISSDHAPILLNTSRTNKMRRRHTTKFEAYWIEHPGFQDVVHKSWVESQQNTIRKLRVVGKELNEWSKKNFGNIFRTVEECKTKLFQVQMEAHLRDTRLEEKELKEKIEHYNIMQQRYYEQRSKFKWIPNVDKNTRVFHMFVMQRKKKN
ncbi:uncharacterized protein LOC113359877 [Papaver somniferum]|uniref:uncharacterized protein LOC113359877 n=1 Tax=Papaver somniferum TaxID=3469 RepID=UPI000E6F762C|nr:uncharacterized protein LOC113359877 [Papaver somniferum]